jgi:predicted ATP-grasp superfamily ATP-dependent carboligase
MTLLDQLNDSRYDFYFLCVDKFLDINLPQLKNFISLSPEKLNITLKEKNSGRLLSHPLTQKFIQDNSTKTGHKPAIIPFKPSAKIDFICQKNNWTLIANPASLNRFIEDKIKFTQICQKTNLPIIYYQINSLNPETYHQAQDKFGPQLVIQTHFGWAGNSTHLSSNFNDLNISPGTVVKFSPFLDGYSLLNNCCLTAAGLIQSPPALQYTGLKPLTQNPFATVGRQWPSFASPEIIDQIKNITEKFSLVLQQYNYRGFFGLDFFVHQDKVFLLECNPRLTASFAFYTQLEFNHHLDPLFFYHLASFINLDYPLFLRFDSPLVGSEITLKNKDSATIKKYQQFTAFSPQTNPVTISSDIIHQLL